LVWLFSPVKRFPVQGKPRASGRLGRAADISFHITILDATGHHLQVPGMTDVYDYLFAGVNTYLEARYQRCGGLATIVDRHPAVCQATRCGIPNGHSGPFDDRSRLCMEGWKVRMPERARHQ
jgi:hypothetical protein